MNLGPTIVSATYKYLLNQSGSAITLGTGQAVDWDAGNIVTKTGDQTITGIKTFKADIIVEGDSNLGVNAGSANSFGGIESANSFGVGATNNNFGEGAETNNTFGTFGNNAFGQDASFNAFGQNAAYNDFGKYATAISTFGYSGQSNSFGSLSLANGFGFMATVNNFGSSATSNTFGQNTTGNTYGEGRFIGPIRLNLAAFSGSSNQAGQTGEARVSGSGLYICTGTNLWGRVFLSSF